MPIMNLTHHGGHVGVTGSCHELHYRAGRSLLVDCGLFQGKDAARHPTLEIEFPVEPVTAVVLTHAHIDHVGRLPYLLAAGYGGPLICSRPTARLLPLVLEDALKLGFTRKRWLIARVLAEVEQRLVPLDYNRWHAVDGDLRLRLQRAGHILGSAYVEVDAGGERIVFSGDLGPPHTPLLYSPRSPARADVLVLESTYGDRRHEGRPDRRARLRAVLERTLANGGATIVPAFSLGRTQELLYEINAIFTDLVAGRGAAPREALLPGRRRGPEETPPGGGERSTGQGPPTRSGPASRQAPTPGDAPVRARWARRLQDVDVIVDSPLAARFTEVYEDCEGFWDAEAKARVRSGDQPLVFDHLMTVSDHRQHRWTVDYLRRKAPPAVVIAGSGMCTGGRVVNYLKALLGDDRTDVVFAGYQAAGTPGRALQAGRKRVTIDGTALRVQARIHSLSGYSAHADQADLLRFARGIRRGPERVVLVHGEATAKRALRQKLAALA